MLSHVDFSTFKTGLTRHLCPLNYNLQYKQKFLLKNKISQLSHIESYSFFKLVVGSNNYKPANHSQAKTYGSCYTSTTSFVLTQQRLSRYGTSYVIIQYLIISSCQLNALENALFFLSYIRTFINQLKISELFTNFNKLLIIKN
ncbi:Hypothetical_protein [Hexamita inflata]|uniref:Hypothetical_protein n=1 Tax=Hexamita inflata TaxID=28002 RepID=A0AA86U5X7_9EUKA|nr:Hypothetical protein HINF_LOCUS4338 [Hexamita inflata]CAI9944020.1 Hypothetical protein HINF_LOCUS31665 [Hexamita inflata]